MVSCWQNASVPKAISGPGRDKIKNKPNNHYVRTTSGQYIPLQLLNTKPPTLTQQITTKGVISPEAWVEIQEKVNALAENDELIDKRQKTLGRSHQKLKKLTKAMHKNSEQSMSNPARMKLSPKKQDEKKDKKRVKFTSSQPNKSGNTSNDKQVNVVHAMENPSRDKSDNNGSDSPIPDEVSVTSTESNRPTYWDLLSSSSEEMTSDSNQEDDEE